MGTKVLQISIRFAKLHFLFKRQTPLRYFFLKLAPMGTIFESTPKTANRGGWNCRHQLYPVPDYVVPKEIREKLEKRNTFAGSNPDKTGEKMTAIESEQQTQSKQHSEAYLKNIEDVEKALGIKRGREMTFLEANEGRGNPNYSKGGGYTMNCQSCVVTNELRRRGFDLSAQMNPLKKGSVIDKLSRKTEMAWIDENGNTPKSKKLSGHLYDVAQSKNRMKTNKEISTDLNDLTKEEGRYHISYRPKRQYSDSWHIITYERRADGSFQFYDPQSGIIEDWNLLVSTINRGSKINILRVDNLLVNTTIINDIVVK